MVFGNAFVNHRLYLGFVLLVVRFDAFGVAVVAVKEYGLSSVFLCSSTLNNDVICNGLTV